MDDEKCPNVDMSTGLRDCWSFPCYKDHQWRYKEIHIKERNKQSYDENGEPAKHRNFNVAAKTLILINDEGIFINGKKVL